MGNKRVKTSYLGVYYREAQRIGGKGAERIFYITFKRDGRMVEEKVGAQFRDAMTPAKAARIRAERIEGKRTSRKELREQEQTRKAAEENRWTVDRLWEQYKAGRKLNKGLYVDDLRYVKFLKFTFGAKEPADIIHLEVDRLRINLSKTLSPQTTKHVLGILKRIINYGENKGLCKGPGFKIEMPPVDNKVTEDLTQEELSRLLDAIDRSGNTDVGAMMKMALFTGMRRGEMFKLEWRDVDFERGFMRIRDPKGGLSQTIPLNDGARAVLENQPRREGPLVFPGKGGNQRTNVRWELQKIKETAGLPKDFRPLHGLRHVYASMLASSGQVDMYTLQKLLTHKSSAMTQRYAHLRDESLKRASQVAGDIITAATNGKKVVRIESKNTDQ